MIVVDSNILAYLYLPGPHSESADALLRLDPQWAAPLLWRSELRNVLAGCQRRSALSFAQVCAIQRGAEDLMAGAEFEVDSRQVFELLRTSACSAYDCEFVALARQLATRLITMDKQLLRAFPGLAEPLPAV